MFRIVSINVDTATRSSILFGGLPGKEVIQPFGALLGPEGSVYVLAFLGLGYIKLTDVGERGNIISCRWEMDLTYSCLVSGPGDWSVQVSGSSTNWFYRGEGHASITVSSRGQYKIQGGANEISGEV